MCIVCLHNYDSIITLIPYPQNSLELFAVIISALSLFGHRMMPHVTPFPGKKSLSLLQNITHLKLFLSIRGGSRNEEKGGGGTLLLVASRRNRAECIN